MLPADKNPVKAAYDIFDWVNLLTCIIYAGIYIFWYLLNIIHTLDTYLLQIVKLQLNSSQLNST